MALKDARFLLEYLGLENLGFVMPSKPIVDYDGAD
jgi:hypothetical protein